MTDFKKEFEKKFADCIKKYNSPVDNINIQNLCDLYVTIKTSYAKLQEEGYVVNYPNGTVGISQWNTVYLKNLKIFNELAKEYGLTPLSKAKLTDKKNKAENSETLSAADKAMIEIFKGE